MRSAAQNSGASSAAGAWLPAVALQNSELHLRILHEEEAAGTEAGRLQVGNGEPRPPEPSHGPGRRARAREEGGLIPGPAGDRWSCLPSLMTLGGQPSAGSKGEWSSAPISLPPALPRKVSAHPCAFDTCTSTAIWQGMKPRYSVCSDLCRCVTLQESQLFCASVGAQSCPTLCNPKDYTGLCPWGFVGKNNWSG